MIVLSWIQSFLQRFIKNNVEDESFGNNIHSDNKSAFHSYTLNENGKDLNIKISYQYPKSKLSYPVNSQATLEKTEKRVRHTKAQSQTEQSIKRVLDGKSIKKEQHEKPVQRIPKRTGPFQPTEIPSPVFGFKRPQKHEETIVVEHELSHFLPDDFEKQWDPAMPVIEPIELIEPIEPELTELEVTNTSNQIDDVLSVTVPNAIQEQAATLEAESETLITDNQVTEEQHDIELDLKNQSEVTIEEKAEVPKTKRSHLPFNVMMLKQDKLKWEESKRRRKLEQERTCCT